MTLWRIYHRDREYAREHGDPCLGEVLAVSKDDAERVAESRWYLPTGAWAVRESIRRLRLMERDETAASPAVGR